METIPPTPSTPLTPTGGVRNAFLTVICILSFIGSGLGIIKAIRSYATADFIANSVGGVIKNAKNQIDQQDNPPSFVKQIMGSVIEDMNPDFLRKLAIFQFISNLLTLSGAILMWNLKKIGFYLYITGIIVLVIAPLLMGKLVGAIGATIIGFEGVIFIVMYAVNLKQMTRRA